jgi:alpha-tubulin suppressor-like RCC1 family protein
LVRGIEAGGRLYLWGGGEVGQLGSGHAVNATVPTLVQFFVDHDIVIQQLSLGCAHTVAVSEEQQLYAWGEGKWGKLGIRATTNVLLPTLGMLFVHDKVCVCTRYLSLSLCIWV